MSYFLERATSWWMLALVVAAELTLSVGIVLLLSWLGVFHFMNFIWTWLSV